MITALPDQYQLNEFRLNPILAGLTEYKSVRLPEIGAGLSIYSSPKIESIFYDRIKNSKIVKPIMNKVKEGIDNKVILIGYTEPSSFYFILDKVKRFFGLRNTYSLGYFDPSSETIYILLDDNVNIMGNEVYRLDVTLVHEIIHLASMQYEDTDIHKNTYKNFLGPYYGTLISGALKIFTGKVINFDETLSKEFSKSIEKLFKLNEGKVGTVEDKIKNSYKIWMEFFNNNIEIDTKAADKICRFLMFPYRKNYLMGEDIGFKFDDIDNKYLADHLYIKAYENIGILRSNTIPGQEFIFPSEVLSISNQNGLHTEIIKSINKINMSINK